MGSNRKRGARRAGAILAVVGLATMGIGIATPAYAWGSGKIYNTTNCITGPGANKWSNTNASQAAAGTNESGHFCPGGRQTLSAAIRYVAGVNGGESVGFTIVTGYASVSTSAASSSLYRGGVHNFGGVPGWT